MMKNIIVVLILFLSLLTLSSDAYSVDFCSKQNISSLNNCYYCLAIDSQIIKTENKTELVVGDYFHYNVSIYNLGKKDENLTCMIYVESPDGKILSNRSYNISINMNNSVGLFPEKNYPNKTYDVVPIDSNGIYKINVRCLDRHYPAMIKFIKFFENCEYVYYYENFTFYVDSIPSWEYERNVHAKTIETESASMEKSLESFTIAIFILTLISCLETCLGLIKKYCGIFTIIYSLSLFLFLLNNGILKYDIITLILAIVLVTPSILILIGKENSEKIRNIIFYLTMIQFGIILYFLSNIDIKNSIMMNPVWGSISIFTLAVLSLGFIMFSFENMQKIIIKSRESHIPIERVKECDEIKTILVKIEKVND